MPRQFPDSLVTWNAAFPTVPAPISLWPCQDANGLADVIGTANLTDLNRGETYQQTGDPFGRFSVGFSNITAHIRAANSTVLNQTTGNFSVYFRFGYNGFPSNNGHVFMRKKSSSAGTNGWNVSTNASGNMLGIIDTPAAAGTTVTVLQNFWVSGSWHDVIVVYDRASTLSIYTDLGDITGSIAAHAGSSVSDATLFGFGDTNGNLNSAARVQYSYGGFFDYALSAVQVDKVLFRTPDSAIDNSLFRGCFRSVQPVRA